MIFFQQFFLDREKDIAVDLYLDGEKLFHVIRTPNHHTGNLISNLARLCALETSEDENGLKVIRGEIPCYFDGDNRKMYILRVGTTKIDREHFSGRESRAESLDPGHLQNADESDERLPARRGKDDRQDLYPLRLQIPYRSAYAHERQPFARCADRAGHHASDPVSLLLYQKAGPALHGRSDQQA